MTPAFTALLDWITERSAALRTAVAAADDVEAPVPGCPDWTLRDLTVHVGQVQRIWAARALAGDADVPPMRDVPDGDLLAWSVQSTDLLTGALRDVGPDAYCRTWWEESGAPSSAGAVARHQVQEAAVHAHDAQSAIGDPEPLPSDIAVDCVDEFLVVSIGAMDGWPHASARVTLVADEGPRWTVDLGEGGATAATISGTASDLLLALYSRIPVGRLHVEGDAAEVARMVEWVSTE